jgi:hypothetical protein
VLEGRNVDRAGFLEWAEAESGTDSSSGRRGLIRAPDCGCGTEGDRGAL